MTKFNVYARRADRIAREAFAQIQEAEKTFKAAEEAKNKGPRSNGLQDAQAAARVARLKADYLEAEQAVRDARQKLPDKIERKLAEIRQQLETALEGEYYADPKDINNDTLTLLQSGILTPAEYERLFTDALEKSNYTMARLIGRAAQEQAEKYSYGGSEERLLTVIAHNARNVGGSAYLTTFDAVADTIMRCIRNPYMAKRYDDLVGRIIEDF